MTNEKIPHRLSFSAPSLVYGPYLDPRRTADSIDVAVVIRMLPCVDLPGLILEIAARTRNFTDALTHTSERTVRTSDLHLSIRAVLMAEACNTGMLTARAFELSASVFYSG